MEIKISLDTIKMSDNEIVQYLEQKGFRIETHERYNGMIMGKEVTCEVRVAIPINEDYNPMKHKSVNTTFIDIIEDNVKKFLLGL